jgi:hypothetical protein
MQISNCALTSRTATKAAWGYSVETVCISFSPIELIGIEAASALIVFVKHGLGDGIGRAVVPSLIGLIEFDCHDHTRADVGAAPFAAARVKLQADLEIISGHRN